MLEQEQDLIKAQKAEADRLKAEMEAEARRELAEMEANFSDYKEQQLAAKQQELERAAVGNAAKDIMARHQEDLARMENKLGSEQSRQKELLQAKLAARKRAREAKLKKQHGEALSKERKEQEKEKIEAKMDSTKKRELDALEQVLTDENRPKAKALIERFCKTRHKGELVMRLRDNYTEMSSTLDATLAERYQSMQEKRSELDARLKAGEMDVEAHRAETDALEESTDPDQVKAEVYELLQPKHERLLDELREAHRDEVRDIFSRFYPDEDFEGPEWQMTNLSMKKLMEENKRKQEEAQRALEEKMAALEQQEAALKQELEEKRQAQMQEFEEKLDAKNQELKAQYDQMVEAKRKEWADKHQETDAAKRAELEEQLKFFQSADQERQSEALAQARQQLEDDLEAERVAQEKEEQRMKLEFEAKLAQRNEQAKQFEMEGINHSLEQELNKIKQDKAREREKVNLEREAQQHAMGLCIQTASRNFIRLGLGLAARRQQGVQLAIRKFKRLYRTKSLALRQHKQLQAMGGGAKNMAAGGGRSRRGGLLMPGSGAGGQQGLLPGAGGGVFPGVGPQGLPFMEKLESIQGTLFDLLKSDDGLFRTDIRAFVDPEEANFEYNEELTRPTVCEASALTATQFVVFRFGAFVVGFLAQALRLPPINLLVASELPPKLQPERFRENAFAKSLQYDDDTRVLFARVERLEDVGRFTVLLIHATAHIAAGTKGSWSDFDPQFMKHFLLGVRAVSAELFFARARKTDSGLGTVDPDKLLALGDGQDAGLGYDETREAFGLLSHVSAKEDVVGEFVDLQQMRSEDDPFYNSGQLLARLGQYKAFRHSSRLRTHLQRLEATASQRARAIQAAKQAESYTEPTGEGVYPEDDQERPGKVALREQQGKLMNQADSLNAQLASVAERLAATSRHLLELQGQESEFKGANVEAGKVTQWFEMLNRRRAQLKTLNGQKQSLLARIKATEANVEIKARELVRLHAADFAKRSQKLQQQQQSEREEEEGAEKKPMKTDW